VSQTWIAPPADNPAPPPGAPTHRAETSAAAAAPATDTKSDAEAEKKAGKTADKKKHRSKWRIFGILLFLLIGLGVAARLALPHVLQWYVNRTIDQNPLYDGQIGDIQVHLWRGAYSIHDVRLLKTTGNVPVPFFAAKRVDLAIQWDALMNRKIVGRVLMVEPELNFVDAPDQGETQTGAGGPWLKIIEDLFPFKINRAEVQNGSVHFRTYTRDRPVDVYLSQLNATIDNLSNIRDEVTPLVTTVQAKALAMDQAQFEFQMKLDPFSYRPTFHMTLRLIGLDVTKINDLALAYGSFDFKRGWFDLVIELDAKEGTLQGYVKPLFRNLQVFSLSRDLQEDNPIQFFWTAVVGLTTKILTNPPRDQFGTLIPFTGSVDGPSPDILATIGNVLRNAFIRAYLPKLRNGGDRRFEGMQFEPPSISDPITVGDQP
jgi:hypothetical protein